MNWIDIKDKLPEVVEQEYEYLQVSKKVLCVNNNRHRLAYLCYDKDYCEYSWRDSGSEGWLLENVTHWMDLPELPVISL